MCVHTFCPQTFSYFVLTLFGYFTCQFFIHFIVVSLYLFYVLKVSFFNTDWRNYLIYCVFSIIIVFEYYDGFILDMLNSSLIYAFNVFFNLLYVWLLSGIVCPDPFHIPFLFAIIGWFFIYFFKNVTAIIEMHMFYNWWAQKWAELVCYSI